MKDFSKRAASLSVAALGLVFGAATAVAQEAPASIHGTVQNAAAQPVKEGEVKLSKDRSTQDDKTRKYDYTFPVDATGNYKGDGVAPGDYVLFYQVNGKTIDYVDHVVVKSGDNLTVNDDMTRDEYMTHLPPEERKKIEEFRKKNAEAMNANKTVANLNQLLTKARGEEKAANWDAAITDMQQATTQKPDEAILWLELGNAQLGKANVDKKPDEFATAAQSFQKAVDTNTASKKPNPAFAGAAFNGMGQAYGKSGKAKEAGDAYDKAAGAEPAKAGMYYFNEAVTLMNAGSSDGAVAAADKAIAADPTRADAYYIKAQSLIGKSTVDSKSGKIIPPDGTMEAYSKYLELQPNGKFAPEIKQIMAGFDEKVTNSFKAGRKK